MRRSRLDSAPADGRQVAPAEVLQEMQAILAKESDWAPGRLARRADGTCTVTTDLACTQRSLSGALHCALSYLAKRPMPPRLTGTVEGALSHAAGQRLDYFDEAPTTTFSDIRRVIASARASFGEAAAAA